MSDLRKIYVADGPGDAHLLRGLLETEGIDAVIRGADFVPLQGGSLFGMETRPSLWVLDDDPARHARAVEIAEGYATSKGTPATTEGETWQCRKCGETIETQFTACWSCGTER